MIDHQLGLYFNFFRLFNAFKINRIKREKDIRNLLVLKGNTQASTL